MVLTVSSSARHSLLCSAQLDGLEDATPIMGVTERTLQLPPDHTDILKDFHQWASRTHQGCLKTNSMLTSSSSPYSVPGKSAGHPEFVPASRRVSSTTQQGSVPSQHSGLASSSLQPGWDITSTAASSAEPLGPHGHPDSTSMNCGHVSAIGRDSILTRLCRCQGDPAPHRFVSPSPSGIRSFHTTADRQINVFYLRNAARA